MNLYNQEFIYWTPMTINNTHIPTMCIISSELMFTHVLNAVKLKRPLTIIRMGDGEAGLMNYYTSNNKPIWLTQSWLDKVGISQTDEYDIKNIGKRLIDAAYKTDFLGTSIWALSQADETWSIEKYIPAKRGYRCSNWYHLEWYATGCAQTLLMNCTYALMHNDAINANKIIQQRFSVDKRFKTKLKDSGTFTMYKNFLDAEDYIKNTNYDVYLISGGPEFKSKMFDISRKYNKILLDVGHGITRCWARNI